MSVSAWTSAEYRVKRGQANRDVIDKSNGAFVKRLMGALNAVVHKTQNSEVSFFWFKIWEFLITL